MPSNNIDTMRETTTKKGQNSFKRQTTLHSISGKTKVWLLANKERQKNIAQPKTDKRFSFSSHFSPFNC